MLIYNRNKSHSYCHSYNSDNNNSNLRGRHNPATNVLDRDDEFQIEIAVPGLDKKEISIDVERNKLKISSKGSDKQKVIDDFLRKEFDFKKFSKVFELPESSDAEKIEARYINGVLKVHIPKKEEAKAKPPREIKIK